MTSPGEGIDPGLLVLAAGEVWSVSRQARLVKNDVGNLAVMIGDEYSGFIDLQTGEVVWLEGVALPWNR